MLALPLCISLSFPSLLPSAFFPSFFIFPIFSSFSSLRPSSLCFPWSEKITYHLKTWLSWISKINNSHDWQCIVPFSKACQSSHLSKHGLSEAWNSPSWAPRGRIPKERKYNSWFLKVWTGKLIVCHFCHNLLVRAVTESPWIQDEGI